MNEVWLSKIAKKGATLIVGEKGRREQRWADCEIFQSDSNPDKIESDPVLICKIFENHQSDLVLICQCKIMYLHFASWGKATNTAILLLAKYHWLKAK